MKKGDILGHEFMGEVVEVAHGVRNLKIGDRVVVPFPIACGTCNACASGLFSVCENSNPNAPLAEKSGANPPPGSSAIRTCSVATRVGRQNWCECHSPTVRSRSRTD
jgi:threonine dehydrogenase-like Zn-dependent dehydrogenase